METNLRSPFEPTMLTTEQLSKRIGVPMKSLIRWRMEFGDGSRGTVRKGPKWVKITPGLKGKIRYPLAFVEQWERERMEAA